MKSLYACAMTIFNLRVNFLYTRTRLGAIVLYIFQNKIITEAKN